jgi:predicted metalloprotease with PDZ domain
VLVLLSCIAGQQPLAYGLEVAAGAPADLKLSLVIPADMPGDSFVLTTPHWRPGDWRPESRIDGIRDLAATAEDGAPVTVNRTTNGAIVRRPGSGSIHLTWRALLPLDAPHHRRFARRDTTLIDGLDAWIVPEGATAHPCTLTLTVPEGWSIASPLDPGNVPATFVAPDFSSLVDAPIVLGRFVSQTIDAGGVSCEVVFLGGPGSIGGLQEPFRAGVAKVFEEQTARLGPAPCPRYLVLVVEEARGSRFGARSVNLGVPARGVSSDATLPLLAVAEGAFRTRIPGHLAPTPLVRPDLKEPAITETLWFVEALARYEAGLTLLHCGLVPKTLWLQALTQRILDWRNHPLHDVVTPVDASKGVHDEAPVMSPNLQGDVLVLALDILIRDASDGARTIDDLVKEMLASLKPETGFSSPDIVAAATKVAGRDLAPWFASHVTGAKEPPLDDTFPRAGLRFDWIQWSVADPGLLTMAEGDSLVILATSSPDLYAIGLRPGDEIITVNLRRVTSPFDVDEQIARLAPGHKLRIDIRREDKTRSFRISLDPAIDLDIPVVDRNGNIVVTALPPGPLLDAGVRTGDVLEKIDSTRITRVAEVIPALRRARNHTSLLTVSRNGKRLLIRVPAPIRKTWRGALSEDPKVKPEIRAWFGAK